MGKTKSKITLNRLSFFNKKGLSSGFIAGLISSLCCITPMVLIFLGLGTVSFAFSFVAYKLEFLLISLFFLSLTTWLFFKREKCSLFSKQAGSFLITSLTVYLLLFFGLVYGLVPTLGPKIYQARLFTKDLGDHQASCHLEIGLIGLELDELSCTSCAAAVKYALEQQPGVIKTEVDLKNNKALVHYDDQSISLPEIIESVPDSFQVEKVINYC